MIMWYDYLQSKLVLLRLVGMLTSSHLLKMQFTCYIGEQSAIHGSTSIITAVVLIAYLHYIPATMRKMESIHYLVSYMKITKKVKRDGLSVTIYDASWGINICQWDSLSEQPCQIHNEFNTFVHFQPFQSPKYNIPIRVIFFTNVE